MPSRAFQIKTVHAGSLMLLGLALFVVTGSVRGQTAAPPTSAMAVDDWQRVDWLKGSEEKQRQAAAGDSLTVKTSQDVKDPFAVATSSSLWQEKVDATYLRRVGDAMLFSYQTSSTLLTPSAMPSATQVDGTPYDLSHSQKMGAQVKPSSALTLNGNVHASETDGVLPADTTITTGVGGTAQVQMPRNALLSMGMNFDRSASDTKDAPITTTTSYDAKYEHPLTPLPLTAVLKGHYEQTFTAGAPVGSMPSLEQSLVWKPLIDTTLQMGLRQQQYQEYPGVDNQFNQALFADWSQKMSTDITWHSYAEMVNTKGLIDQAPASPIASGANGTPQATTPDSNVSLTSTVPLSFQDQTVTFTTGPSFQLQKDLSASFEYSNRWDKNPTASSGGQEQRVSVSVKGSF